MSVIATFIISGLIFSCAIMFFVNLLGYSGRMVSLRHIFSLMCVGYILESSGYLVMVNKFHSNGSTLLSHTVAILGIMVFTTTMIAIISHWGRLEKHSPALVITLGAVLTVILIPVVYLSLNGTINTRGIDSRKVVNVAFYIYKLIALITGIVFAIIQKKKSKRHLDTVIFRCILVCLTLFTVETFVSTYMPSDTYYYFPVNVITHFCCIIPLHIAVMIASNNSFDINNISRFIYSNIEAPILIFNDEARLIVLNEFAEDFFSIVKDDFEGSGISQFFDVADEVVTSEKNISSARCTFNNAICNLSINKYNNNYGDLIGYVVIAADQTEQAKAMEEAVEARAQAEEANKAKSDFLANMSHEIRTPINTIIGMDEMILREAKDSTLLKYANDIKVASTSFLSIINDILDFSKIESGMMELVPVEYEFDSMLADEINVLSFKAREKGLRFFFDIDSSIPKRMYGDDVRVRQIITNLLSNAIKYTSKGRVMFQVKCERIDDDRVEIRIAVTDTGCGIRKEDIGKLFDAFTRVDMKKNRSIEGTGLGLNITNQLVSMMNGSMDIKSTYGKGSTFSCSIIQKSLYSDVIGDFDMFYENYQGNTYTYHKSFEAPDASMLVVDDNVMNISVVENLLKQTKINIVSVTSGEEAIKSAHNNYYDVILMDHMMPHMDGLEAFTAIREDKDGRSSKSPIVAMTANAVAGAKRMYLDYGFNEYLSKPVDPVQLEQLLMKILPPELVCFTNTKVSDWINEDAANAQELKDIEIYLEQNGINAISGLRNMNNSIVNYQNTLKMFVKSANEKVQILKTYLDACDNKNYGIEAHSLKGSAKLIGATRLADVCYKHELAGKESRLHDAALMWNDFVGIINSEVSIIKEYLNKLEYDKEISIGKDAVKLAISDEELRTRIDEIKELSDDYEHRAAKAKIELLMDYQLPEDIFKKVKALYKALNEVDYASAEKICEGL